MNNRHHKPVNVDHTRSLVTEFHSYFKSNLYQLLKLQHSHKVVVFNNVLNTRSPKSVISIHHLYRGTTLDSQGDTKEIYEKIKHASHKATQEKIAKLTTRLVFTRSTGDNGIPNGTNDDSGFHQLLNARDGLQYLVLPKEGH